MQTPEQETLAAKVVIKRVGKTQGFVRAEVWIAQDETGNPKFIAGAEAVVIENAVPKALEAAVWELKSKPAFWKTQITEGE